METFTYEYKGEKYPVFGMDIEHARKNAVLEAFIRYHENNPKIGMTVAQGTDYVSQDKFQKRADTLIGYIQGDIEFFDPESQPVLEVIKEAHSTTKSSLHEFFESMKKIKYERIPFFKNGNSRKYYLDQYESLPEIRATASKRCSGYLAGEDCYLALAAQSGDGRIILGYPKREYERLHGHYCQTPDNVPKLPANYERTVKYQNKKVVSIGGVRNVWRKGSGWYQGQSHCAAIVAAVNNYDYYLSKYSNPDTNERLVE